MAPQASDPDTIRILIATDNHVGYHERDPIRGDDSWKTFHEIMCLAKERDVDMVLLAGDLFHENKPSRKSMYQVMRSLRMNCFGEKPCELEMLSDASEQFPGAFNHVNYEDPDINVAIPVFSIHGNHDDPSGEGHLAALDLLQVAGLLNYYGRTPESDNISIRPVLLQKGRTKLALYGMSNVRDERLFRTFRDGNVKFFQPSTQKDEWFNLMAVHQNHNAHTETNYLPENFLPDFLNLVVWGHEHECLIEPRYNPEMSFHVMQPGSSVATSLIAAESEHKHVAIVSITGKDFKSEPIRLKTVRPFIMKEIVLAQERQLKSIARQDNNRTAITQYLMGIVEKLIEQAKQEWLEAQEGELDEDVEVPVPLIRLKVEYSAPDGGKFDCENPQRFSNRFVGKVANVNDVVQFYRKKTSSGRKTNDEPEMPELAQITLDTVKVEKLVREFLTAQSLTILPQNSFGDAVSQFVDKDDKHAMEMFVNESLSNQVKHLLQNDELDDNDINQEMEQYREYLESIFAQGAKQKSKRKYKPKPDNWDSDMDGHWEDTPGALVHTDAEEEDESLAEEVAIPAKTTARGRPAKGTATQAKAPARKAATTAKKAAPKTTATRGRSKKIVEEESEEDDDVIMIDDDDDEEEEDEESLFVSSKKAPAKRSTRAAPPRAKSPAKKASTRSTTTRQTKLNFSQTPAPASPVPKTRPPARGRAAREPSDDEISDDDDAFEAMQPTRGGRRR